MVVSYGPSSMAFIWLSLVFPVFAATGNSAGDASPWALDLDRFVDKLLRDQAQYFPDETKARNAILEYRRFLYMHQKYPEHLVAASKLVDIVWHEHIIDTKRYMADCERLFGRYLHHYPCFGKGRKFHHMENMLKAYRNTFGEAPREDIWDIFPKKQVDFPGCKVFPSPSPPAPCPPPPPPLAIKLNVSRGTKEELCIDAGSALGAVVTLQKCNTSSPYKEPAPDQAFDGYSDSKLSIGDMLFPYTEEGRCVEMANGNTTNGNHFQMQCCKEAEVPGHKYANQVFTFNQSSGKIYFGDGSKPAKCVYTKKRTVGEPLVIWDCQDVEGQKWSQEGPWETLATLGTSVRTVV